MKEERLGHEQGKGIPVVPTGFLRSSL